MIPITWPELANLHPFAPLEQTKGYQRMFEVLRRYCDGTRAALFVAGLWRAACSWG